MSKEFQIVVDPEFQEILREIEESPEFRALQIQGGLVDKITGIIENEFNYNVYDFLTEKLGCSRPYVSKILRADSDFRFSTMVKLARAAGQDIFILTRPVQSRMNRISNYTIPVHYTTRDHKTSVLQDYAKKDMKWKKEAVITV